MNPQPSGARRTGRRDYDAVVVGAGPNGLAAAIRLAEAGRSVLLVEGAATVGGGSRSAALTLPGFVHDVCAAAHPMALASPALAPLARAGAFDLVQPPAPLAHPFDDGTAAVLERDLGETGATLDGDGPAWQALFGPLVARADEIVASFLGPPPLPPRHPVAMALFGWPALQTAEGLARRRFAGPRARALFAGIAAHAILPLDTRPTAAFGLILGLLAHVHGWPIVRGGSQHLPDAMARRFTELGGEIVTDWMVASLDELPASRAVLLDVTPRQLLDIAGDRLPGGYRRRLSRFRYGPGVFKVDWALDAPVPWAAAGCRRAGTIHLGGTLEEIAASEAAVAAGEPPRRPFVLVVQPSRFDAGRAPDGHHTLWAYCHVPNGCDADMTAIIERQVERFAPGFTASILGRAVMGPAQVEAHDPNYVGGDINGGSSDLRQLFARPTLRWPPYTTPVPGLYLCSSSTPPGGGVHGMCGASAAEVALRRLA